MPYQHRANPEFWQGYRALPQGVRQRADKQFALLSANPSHPSVQFKKIGERHGYEVWSARVTQDFRALAIKEPECFTWFWIGDHNTYDRLIR